MAMRATRPHHLMDPLLHRLVEEGLEKQTLGWTKPVRFLKIKAKKKIKAIYTQPTPQN